MFWATVSTASSSRYGSRGPSSFGCTAVTRRGASARTLIPSRPVTSACEAAFCAGTYQRRTRPSLRTSEEQPAVS
eukprot:8320105-Lingulodinium_polyedra.AAC.1